MQGGVHAVTTVTSMHLPHARNETTVGHTAHVGVRPGLLLRLLLLLLLRHLLGGPLLLLGHLDVVAGTSASAARGRVMSLFPLLVVDFLDGSQLFLELHPSVLEPYFDLSFS